jgi:hypothetical protein
MNRGQIGDGSNFVRGNGPGELLMEQTKLTAITTAGSGVITSEGMQNGYIERTGPAGAYGDTLDTADNLMAANPNFSPGDSFEFNFRNTVAFANTVAVAEGAELAGAFTAVAATSVRRFLVSILATARRQSLLATLTNANAVLTGLTQAQVQSLMPGMGVSAASGITAGTTILAVNSVAGTVTLSANATVTQQIAVTFFPRYNVRGLFSATL